MLSCFSPSRDIFIHSLRKKFSKFSELHVLFGIPGVIQGNIDFHRNVTSFQLDLNYYLPLILTSQSSKIRSYISYKQSKIILRMCVFA